MSNETPSEEKQRKLEALRKALIEGEESGPAGPFDFEAFIAHKRGARRRDEDCPGEERTRD
jgi:Arc/MetJ-type ribon-helix-helix transcriptional regulator